MHRKLFCNWSLLVYSSDLQRYSPLDSDLWQTKLKNSFIIRHVEKALPISQALKTKGTMYRCGLSQYSVLIPFWQYTSGLQVHASCQLHLCIILPQASTKEHTWSRLALIRGPIAHKTVFQVGISFSSIPKKFSIPKVTSRSLNLEISEDIREDTALEQREIQYWRRLDLSYPFS